MFSSPNPRSDAVTETTQALRETYQPLAGDTARILRKVAEDRHNQARLCATDADEAAELRAEHFRGQAEQLWTLAARADQLAHETTEA